MSESIATAVWRIATPWPATGAVATISLEGNITWAGAKLGLREPAVGEVRLVNLGDVDHGLAIRWSTDLLHLCCHGGAASTRAVTRWLLDCGIPESRVCDLNRQFPEARSEIEARTLDALSRAASPLAIDLLLDQPRRWQNKDPVTEPNLAPIELNRLINPPLVVALGPSNIGKSTLINALAGRSVSIVADEPGTTRDHVGVTLDFAGLVVRYLDTPGLRANPDLIESEAALIALDLARHADLVVLCGDPTAPPPNIAHLAPLQIRLCLRSDLGPCMWQADQSVAAISGQGVAEFVALAKDRLVPRTALECVLPWQFWD